jgi:hypothetical protein
MQVSERDSQNQECNKEIRKYKEKVAELETKRLDFEEQQKQEKRNKEGD